MDIDVLTLEHMHRFGERAMYPNAQRLPRHAALLFLEGSSPLRHRALPGAPITAPSGASNCRF